MKVLILVLIHFYISFVAESIVPNYKEPCSYDVTLEQRQQCDISGTTTDTGDDPSTCGSLHIELLQLKIIVSSLTKQVQGIEQSLGLPSQSIDLGPISPSNATANEKSLLQAIANTDAHIKDSESNIAQVEAEIRALGDSLTVTEEELNMTKTIIAQVTDKSRLDMDTLANQIANTSRDVNACNGKLGMHQGNSHPSTHLDDSINMTYCSFEDRPYTCGYVQDKGGDDNTDWYTGSGSRDNNTGPREDHTYGSPKGRYMYLNPQSGVSTTNVPHKARMTSPWYDPAPNYCFRFWYNMYGVNVKTLDIYAMVGNGRGYPIWSSHGNQGQYWHLGEISLDSEYTGQPFKIVFEANHSAYFMRGSSPHYHQTLQNGLAVIAIDDIYSYNVTCNSLPTCPPGSHIRKQNDSSSCYTFHTAPADWYKSHLTCHKEGATSHLVSVNTQEEQEYLVDIIKHDAALIAAGSSGWFTSGNDERLEHHFDWTGTGTPYTSQYSNWHTGQPNNVGDNQDCLLLQYAADNYEWGDVDCDESHPFICEVDLPVI